MAGEKESQKGSSATFSAAQKDGPAMLQRFLDKHPGVRFIRLFLMDSAAICRCIVLTKSHAIEFTRKPGWMQAPLAQILAAGTSNDNIMMDRLERSEYGPDELWPDWSSLRVCTHYPAHAIAMSFVRQSPPGKPFGGHELDGRALLVKQERVAKAMGIDVLMGVEIEFYLYDPQTTDFGKPCDRVSAIGSTSLHSTFTPILDEIVIALEDAGVKISKYHQEDGWLGFFEVAPAPYAPLEAADVMVYTHDLIRSIAFKHGLRATIFPKPYERGPTIGAHVNISISKPKIGTEENFLAGVLASTRALCAFAMPCHDSNERVQGPRAWVGWGKGHKASSVRERRTGFWEIRFADATMNPYLTFAAILALGLDGLRNQKELTIKSGHMYRSPNEEERKLLNVTEKFPLSLEEAVSELEKSEILKDSETGLGETLIERYASIKRKEIETLGAMTSIDRKLTQMKVF